MALATSVTVRADELFFTARVPRLDFELGVATTLQAEKARGLHPEPFLSYAMLAYASPTLFSAAGHLRHFAGEDGRGRLLDAFANLEAREAAQGDFGAGLGLEDRFDVVLTADGLSDFATETSVVCPGGFEALEANS